MSRATASDRSTTRQKTGIRRNVLGAWPYGCQRVLGGTAEAGGCVKLSRLVWLGGKEVDF